MNLIVAKNSRIEVFIIESKGLKPIKEVNIYGKIAVLKLFRQADEKKDFIFILTQAYQAMILECKYSKERDEFEIVTKAHGNVSDKIGKPAETGILAVIDPQARVIGMRLYEGLFKIIPLEKDSNELKAYSLRMEDVNVQDVEFLYGATQPTLILIHQDNQGRHIKTHEISLRDKEFVKVSWKQDNVETEATMLIPVPTPLGGALVIG